MSKITRFEIKKLHGFKTVDLQLTDNTLILVGENGAGKTTVLHLLYYLLSGQWASMARYHFEEISITIANRKHTLRYSDLEKSLHEIDHRVFNRLPPTIRRRLQVLLEQKEGHLVAAELEMLCHRYDIPLQYLLQEVDLLGQFSKKKNEQLKQTLRDIRDSFEAQLLYLPTYRRIEQELSLIFKGVDERELKNRRELLAERRNDVAFVELVEFGMKDVEDAIKQTLVDLDRFARQNLNNLTFGYLGDIVERRYSNVDLKGIMDASEQTIANILNRIQEPVLTSENKQHLREIIDSVKANNTNQTEHTQVICHYFTKLMTFQKELEKKETQIVNFCSVCNEYMADKEFEYDISKFGFAIHAKGGGNANRDIQLHHLSSGEKQIVSLFSHLYLSGGANYFVLIDEPELSLSVPWQRRFLLDIRKGHFCTGLVAVTHSPFIYDNELRGYAHGLGEFVM